jgi:hypothetical protein
MKYIDGHSNNTNLPRKHTLVSPINAAFQPPTKQTCQKANGSRCAAVPSARSSLLRRRPPGPLASVRCTRSSHLRPSLCRRTCSMEEWWPQLPRTGLRPANSQDWRVDTCSLSAWRNPRVWLLLLVSRWCARQEFIINLHACRWIGDGGGFVPTDSLVWRATMIDGCLCVAVKSVPC